MNFSFATCNIDQSYREERCDATKWDNRCEAAVELLRSSTADILCVQELRSLDCSRYSADDVIAMVTKGTRYGVCRWHHNRHMPCGAAIFYDRTRFDLMETKIVRYCTNDGIENGRSHFYAKFTATDTGVEFGVINVHFPEQEKRKWEALDALLSLTRSVTHPLIIAGSYNFFDDLEGGAMRDNMSDKYTDAAWPLYEPATDQCLSGTFYGYASDPHCKEFDDMSRLDHIFISSGVSRLRRAEVHVTHGKPFPRDRSYPTDHLMIMVHLSISRDRGASSCSQ